MKRLAVSSIIVADRFRHDFGDLPALARSIEAEGLLQPIGITEANRLVFGERRLAACRDVLGWTEIDVRVVNVTSIIAGEFAENEMRKDFTPSERVAIAEAVRREMAGRQGGDRKSEAFQGAHLPTLKSNGDQEGQPSHLKSTPGRARDAVARQVGFGSGKQLERAEKVVQLGAPQVVAKVDAGKLPISKAANIVQLPAAEQVAAVAERDDTDAKDQALRSLRHEIEMHVMQFGADAYTHYVTKHDARPDPTTAATIGKLLGRQVRAADGTMQPPKSRAALVAEREAHSLNKQDDEHYNQVYRLRQALVQISFNDADPAVLIPSIRTTAREEIDLHIEKSVAWINKFAEEWRKHGR